MTVKLPRTIRLDQSDTHIFEQPAEPGEWAVAGSFLFWDADVARLEGKARAAFRSGFVGIESLGFSTLVVVSMASKHECNDAIEALAHRIHVKLGAPDLATARAAAAEEIAFAASLCEHEIHTLLAIQRRLEGGQIKEQFRALRQNRETKHAADPRHANARAFEFIEIDEDPAQEIDLMKCNGRV